MDPHSILVFRNPNMRPDAQFYPRICKERVGLCSHRQMQTTQTTLTTCGKCFLSWKSGGSPTSR